MKKIFVLMLVCIMLSAQFCVAETAAHETTAVPADPMSWETLATVGGASVFVLIVVQLTKSLLDKLIKIPTTLYAYIIAVITMLLATVFTTGLTPSAALLTLFNGWIVSATASKSYDVMAGR